MDGYDALIPRLRALAAHPDVAASQRSVLAGLLQFHEDQTVARETARGWLADAERHVEAWRALERRAGELRVPVAHMDAYPRWRDAARTLAGTGEAVLGDEDRYGAYLDAAAAGKPRARLAVEQLRDRIVETRAEAAGRVEAFVAAAGKHMDARDALRDAALDRLVEVTQVSGYRDWHRQADRLVKEARGVLSDHAALRAWLHGNPAGKERMEGTLAGLGAALREDDEEPVRSRRDAREQRRLDRRVSAGLMFAADPDVAAAQAEAPREAPALSRLGHAVGRLVGGAEYEDRMQTESYRREALERWRELKRDWNRQVKRAVKEGVHVIHTDGCKRLHKKLETLAGNTLLDGGIEREIRAVLHELGEARVNAGYVKTRHDFILHDLERREALEAQAAGKGVAVSDLADYDRWRDGSDEAVDRVERILAEREDYGLHLHGAARGRESLASALSRVREMLAEDDRRLAETFAGRRQGEDAWERGERIARLLDDPDELRKLRQQRAQRKEARGHEERRRKGRYRSRGMRM